MAAAAAACQCEGGTDAAAECMVPLFLCRRRQRSALHATAHQQQQQQQGQRLQLSPEARVVVYNLRRVNVGEALRRLEDPSLANEPLIGGTTLLHALAEQRDAATVAALIPAALAAGADPNRPDSQARTCACSENALLGCLLLGALHNAVLQERLNMLHGPSGLLGEEDVAPAQLQHSHCLCAPSRRAAARCSMRPTTERPPPPRQACSCSSLRVQMHALGRTAA